MGMILSCQLGYKRASRGPLSAPEGAHCIIWMTVLVYSLFRAWVSSTAMSSIDGGRHQSSWLGFATLLNQSSVWRASASVGLSLSVEGKWKHVDG